MNNESMSKAHWGGKVKNKIIKTIAIAGAIAGASICMAGCDPETVVNSTPTGTIFNFKNTWTSGESFSLAGAKLKIALSDGVESTVEITEDMIKEMPDMSTAGTKTITINYAGVEYTITIEVLEEEESSYEVLGYENQYALNSTFDLSNLQLQLNYELNQPKLINVTESMITAMPNMSTAGTKTVTINYAGKTYQFDIDVVIGDTKEQMLEKINNFMSTYNQNAFRNSSTSLKISGTEKYLDETVEFDQLLSDIAFTNSLKIEGAQIYKAGDGRYVIYKEVSSREEMFAFLSKNNISTLNSTITMIVNYPQANSQDYIINDGSYSAVYSSHVYGTRALDSIFDFASILYERYGLYNLQRTTFDELTNVLVASSENGKMVYQTGLSKTMYKSIINSIVKSTTDVDLTDLVSNDITVKAQLDTLTLFEKVLTNLEEIDYYNYIVNELVLPESNYYYANLVTDEIIDMFNIENENAISDLKFEITTDIQKIRDKDITPEGIYNAIKRINNILQGSDGDDETLLELDLIVNGINLQNPHMLSDFVYSLRELDGIYTYSNDEKIAVSDTLINQYYTGLKSIIRRLEDINEETNKIDLANAIIADLRSMDEVTQFFEEHQDQYYGLMAENVKLTSYVRMGVEYYVQAYEGEIVTNMIEMYATYLPDGYENVKTALIDCADLIYSELSETEPDYVDLIMQLCNRLGQEKDYYIQQYQNGDLTIFTDFFNKYVGSKMSTMTGDDLITAQVEQSIFAYLDSVIYDGYNYTAFINELHEVAGGLKTFENVSDEYVQVADIVYSLTDSTHDFEYNLKQAISNHKKLIKSEIKLVLSSVLYIDNENEEASSELDSLIDYHLTAYARDQFKMGLLLSELNEFIDKYCDEETKVQVNTTAILATLLANDGEEVDYNELLSGMELPAEIRDVDFNKLINETMKDSATYENLLTLKDVDVQYVTDEVGTIIGETLVITLKANYDIVISSMDADLTLTINIEF